MSEHPGINLRDTVVRNLNSVSNFALYLVAPQYLDVATANYFSDLTQHKRVDEVCYNVCQIGVEAPAYTILTHMVSLLCF